MWSAALLLFNPVEADRLGSLSGSSLFFLINSCCDCLPLRLDLNHFRTCQRLILLVSWQFKPKKKYTGDFLLLMTAVVKTNFRWCLDLTLKYSTRPLQVILLPLISFTSMLRGLRSQGTRTFRLFVNSASISSWGRGRQDVKVIRSAFVSDDDEEIN